MSPSKKKPRVYRSAVRKAGAEETRASILTAARTLLTTGRGVASFSLDNVARESGVTRLTVYNQFKSRRGLIEAVFDDLAEQGGLFSQIPQAFAEPEPRAALRRFVAIFCDFWSRHRKAHPKLWALMMLDDEVATTLRQRNERRRGGLAVMVDRLDVRTPAARGELVDTLFALTSFDFYDMLAGDRRAHEDTESLVQDLVEDAVTRYTGRSVRSTGSRGR